VSLDWPYGQPLVVDLAWANRSQLRPIRDPQQADLRTDGATASFTAAGDWALLRLAETHRPQAGPATDAYDPNRILLEFRVPVVPEKSPAGAAPADTARLHLGVDLATKDPKTQAPLPLTLPAVFPRFAPNHEELTWTRKSRN
jgi:type VI secretion system protein ImpL